MATDAIERIYKLTVDGTQAIRHLENIEKATTGTDSKLASLGNTIKGGLAAFAIKETAGQLVSFLQDTAKAMDDLGDSAQKLGIGAESLETFRLAAQLSGSDIGTMDTAIQKLSKNMAEFDGGSKNVVEAFGKIGVNPQGKSVATVLEDIADAFQKLPDDANKTALAMELLGKSGAELIPTLDGGSEGLKAFNKQLNDLGLALSDEDIRNAQALGDAMDLLQKRSEGVARSFLTGLIPALTEIVTGFNDGSVAADKWNYYGKQTGQFLKELVAAAKGTAEAFWNLGKVGVAAFQSLTTFDTQPLKDAWSNFEQFGQRYQQTMADMNASRQLVEDSKISDVIAKEIGGWQKLPDAARPARDAIADTGKAAKTAKEQISDYAKTLNSLNQEFDSLTAKLEDWNRVELLLAQVRRENLKLSNDELLTLTIRAAEVEDLTRALEAQTEAEKAFQDAVSKGEERTTDLQGKADAWKQALDPMILYQQKYAEILQLEQGGFLTATESWKAREQVVKDAEKAMDEFNKKGQETDTIWGDVAKTLDDAIGQGLADVLLDSEKSIKDWVSSFLQQMARILMNKAITGLLSSLFGGASGGGGGIFSTIASGVGSLFSASAAPSSVATSTVMSAAAAPAPMLMSAFAAPMALAATPTASPITTYDVGTLTPAAGGSSVTAQGQTTPQAVTYITVQSDGTSNTTGDDIRLAKKIDSAVKNVIVNEMRPGGLLSGSRQS